MAKWTDEETSFLEVLNKNNLIGKDVVDAFKMKFKSNRSNASIVAKNNKIKNEMYCKNEDKEIEKKEILKESPEEIILKHNEEIEVVDMVKNVKEKNNYIGAIGITIFLVILVCISCMISVLEKLTKKIGNLDMFKNVKEKNIDNDFEPNHMGAIGITICLALLVYLGCLISPNFYFGSMIGYFIANTFFNRLGNQGEISIFSITLPFIPVLNVLIGIFIMFDFIEGRNKPFISSKENQNV